MCLGKGNGNWVQWLAYATARWCYRQTGNNWFLLSLRPHVFQFSRRKVPTQNGSVESCQDGSVLFLLLGLLFVDLFLCFRLLWVAFLRGRGRSFGWNNLLCQGLCSAPNPGITARHGVARRWGIRAKGQVTMQVPPPLQSQCTHSGMPSLPCSITEQIILEHSHQALCTTLFLLFWKEIFTEPTTYFPTLCRRVNQTQWLKNIMRTGNESAVTQHRAPGPCSVSDGHSDTNCPWRGASDLLPVSCPADIFLASFSHPSNMPAWSRPLVIIYDSSDDTGLAYQRSNLLEW